jgi:hypothetical protein
LIGNVKGNVLAYIRESQETLREDDELHGWEDITSLARFVDKVVVAEICESTLLCSASAQQFVQELCDASLLVADTQRAERAGQRSRTARYTSTSGSPRVARRWRSSPLIAMVSEQVDISVFARERTSLKADDDDETKVPAASVRDLPSLELEGLWRK